MPFGKRLKEARLAMNMTQEDLAKAAGVTKGAIGNYESEVSSPKETILIKLMKILNIDANFLYQDYMGVSEYSTDELRLVTAYRAAEPAIREAALTMLENSAEKKQKDAPIEKKAM